MFGAKNNENSVRITKIPIDVEPDQYIKYFDLLKTELDDELDKRENSDIFEQDGDEVKVTKIYKVKGSKERNQDLISEIFENVLIVQNIDLQIIINGINHNTEKYGISKITPKRLVIRRGQNFSFSIKFSREYNAAKDFIYLDLSCGPDPKEVKHTKVKLLIKEAFDKKNEWAAKINNSEGETVNFIVHIPATAITGLWRLKVTTGLLDNPNCHLVQKVDQYIYLLFNPWCPEDQVFMEGKGFKDEDWDGPCNKEEYVLNECGNILVGISEDPTHRPWVFGQFDYFVLPTVMIIIEQSGLNLPERNNPLAVVRAICAMVNSKSDNGIMKEKLTSPYKCGTPPTAWTGSIGILEQFVKSGGMPVKYGQCWVFSGIVTTLCRALGIPCRPVTNYFSAHETDSSMCIERYFDEEGKLNKFKGIWCFHVWNEVWMARPDLPEGYGGWQAIDVTPQQNSDISLAGPASVKAIKNGEFGLSYNTSLFFAEVNADLIHWHKGDYHKYIKGNVLNCRIGAETITKERVYRESDISYFDWNILRYKAEDDSEEMRLCLKNTFLEGDKPSQLLGIQVPEVKFIWKTYQPRLGMPFVIILQVVNLSEEKHEINMILSCSSCTYTGDMIAEIDKHEKTEKIEPGAETIMTLAVDVEDYIDKLGEQRTLKVIAIAKILETNHYFSEERDIHLINPTCYEINEREENAKVGEEFIIDLNFTNPLSKPLTKCYFNVESPGLCRFKTKRISDIGPNAEVRLNETFKAKEKGSFIIVLLFHSNELPDVIQHRLINIL